MGPEAKPVEEIKPATEIAERSLLDRIAEEGRIGQTPEERRNGKLWLKDLVQDVMAGQMTVSNDTEAMINSRIADLDALISRQLNEVMHSEPLQKLEASWRGLHYFVQQTETSSNLKIKLLNVSKSDLFKDLDKAVEFDQSAIFKKIYEEEYGVFDEGGAASARLPGPAQQPGLCAQSHRAVRSCHRGVEGCPAAGQPLCRSAPQPGSGATKPRRAG